MPNTDIKILIELRRLSSGVQFTLGTQACKAGEDEVVLVNPTGHHNDDPASLTGLT